MIMIIVVVGIRCEVTEGVLNHVKEIIWEDVIEEDSGTFIDNSAEYKKDEQHDVACVRMSLLF